MNNAPILTASYGETRLVPVKNVSSPKPISRYEKVGAFLSSFFSFTTKSVIVVFAVALLAVTWQEIFRPTVVLEPIGSPKALIEMGMSPEVSAQRIWDAVVKINDGVETVRGRTSFVSEARQIKIVEPKSGLSIRGFAGLLRSLLNRPQSRVSGEFICYDDACSIENVKLRIRVIKGEMLRTARVEPMNGNGTLDTHFHEAGIELLRIVDPYVLSIFLKKKKKYAEAKSVVKNVIARRDSEEKWAHLSLGSILGSEGNFEEALLSFDRAIDLDASFSIGHNNRGNVLRVMGKPEEAIQAFNTALKFDPENLVARIGHAIALSDLGVSKSTDEAESILREILRKDPTLAAAHNGLGNILSNRGDHEEAIRSFLCAVELDPGDISALNNLGNSLNAVGRNEEAITVFQQAIELAPDEPVLYSRLGLSFYENDQFEEAVGSFNQTIELNSEFVNPFVQWQLSLSRVLMAETKTCAEVAQLLNSFKISVTTHNEKWRLVQFDSYTKDCDKE
jgi:tetratricopeptide (TPR) repeat protein